MANWGTFIKIAGGALVGAGATGTIMHFVNKAKTDALNDQILTLQNQNARLVELLSNKDYQIEKLMLKYKLFAAGHDINEITNQRLKVKMHYALKDYAEIWVKRMKSEVLFNNDIVFFNAMDKFVEGKPLSSQDVSIIDNRMNLKYSSLILGLISPDVSGIVNGLNGN